LIVVLLAMNEDTANKRSFDYICGQLCGKFAI